jgi:hypothetical protein
LARCRTEVVEADIGQLDVALDAEMGLGEEIGVARDGEPAAIEDGRLHPERGRIVAGLGANVADVLRAHLEVAQAQWLGSPRLHVGDVTVLDREIVDLERIGRLQGILPRSVTATSSFRSVSRCSRLM